MPVGQANTARYVYLGLLGAAAVSLIVGLVLFIAATAFEGYIAALMVMALGGCCYAAARELKGREAKAEAPPSDPLPTKTDPET